MAFLTLVVIKQTNDSNEIEAKSRWKQRGGFTLTRG